MALDNFLLLRATMVVSVLSVAITSSAMLRQEDEETSATTNHIDFGFSAYCNYPCNASEGCNLDQLPGVIPCDRTVTGDISTGYSGTTYAYWPHLSANGTPINGGVPQKGNLTLHLEVVQSKVPLRVPDVNFKGNIILDFELWKPTWRFVPPPYQQLSIQLAIEADPTRLKHNATLAREAAKEQFEAGALEFYVQTVKLVQRMRPLAAVGYYGYPTTGINEPNATRLPPEYPDGYKAWQEKENDRLHPLWEASGGLFPEVYMQWCPLGQTSCEQAQPPSWWAEHEVAMYRWVTSESVRLSLKYVKGRASPPRVLPMSWALYLETSEHQYLKEDDVWRVVEAVWQPPHVTSLVSWGGPWELNNFANQNVSGPVLSEAHRTSANCSTSLCNGHGWCSTLRPTNATTCICAEPRSGHSCLVRPPKKV